MKHEDYVSFKQAKKLKELGFDLDCEYIYYLISNNNIPIFESYCTANYNEMERNWNAPTLSEAQKWLREVKGKIIIPCTMHRENIMKYDVYIVDEPIDLFDHSEGFDTYEQAISAGIDKAIELLKENGE